MNYYVLLTQCIHVLQEQTRLLQAQVLPSLEFKSAKDRTLSKGSASDAIPYSG